MLPVWQRPLFSFYLPAAVIFIFAAVMVFAVVERAAGNIDALALENEQALAETVTDGLAEEMLRTIGDYAYWDDAYDTLSAPEPDPAWIGDNISQSLNETFGISASFVFRDGRLLAAPYTATEVPGGFPQTVAVRRFIEMISAAPSAEAAPRGGFLAAYGKIYLVAAARVTPHTPGREGEADTSPPVVLLWARLLDADAMAEFAQRYHLDGFSFTKAEVPSDAFLALEGVDGQTAGYFYWTTTAPGARMAEAIWPFVITAAIGVLFGFGVLGGNWSRMQRRLQVTRVQVEAAREANRSKSMFLANMSHELRTPLNAIIGFSEVIQHEMFGPLGNEKYREYVGNIRDSGQHLLHVINDVLSLSKLESGQGTLSLRPLEPATIAAETCKMLDMQVAQKGIVLSLLGPREPLYINGDETALRQVLINLAGNAVKFTDAGAVTIMLDTDAAGSVRIQVEDTGPGISEDKLPFLTQPFFQVEDVYQRKNGGTGLGLSITRILVERMMGKMQIESEIGQGTRVTLIFSRHFPAAAADTVKAA